MTEPTHWDLMLHARDGDRSALGSLLEHYRPYLMVLAERYMDDRMRGRLDPADLVQITFMEAQRDLESFRGEDLASFLAWLRNILRNNVSSAHQRHLYAQKRSARREINISQQATDSQLGLGDVLPSETTSPSQRVMRDEAAVALALSLEKLPLTQREALRLRYLEGWSLKQISERLEKSEMAVAGLLKRGLRSLRSDLDSQKSSVVLPKPPSAS